MHTLWNAIVGALKDMARESVQAGKPYALRGYPDFHREECPNSFNPTRWEEPYFAALAARLPDKGIAAETETRYPAHNGRCDLVVKLPSKKRVWIEVKTAFVESLSKSQAGSIYAYDYDGDARYTPTGKGSWIAGVTDLGDKDVQKLATLTETDADFQALLLIGFDRKLCVLDESKLYSLLPVENGKWEKCHASREGVIWDDYYPVRAGKGFRDRVWMWYAPTGIDENPNSSQSSLKTPSSSKNSESINHSIIGEVNVRSFAAWLAEWATGDNKESYLDVFLEAGHIRYARGHTRSEEGKELRKHLFGSSKAPNSDLVRRAIDAVGSPTALAEILAPIIAAGMGGPYGALKNALEQINS